ncbi:MAG: DUF4249 domain-containing protein [Chitinophagaceae bacterium]|nr:DUF4249 domain-containing protein [Chitinophagaceae bacterium]MBX3257673.1 DUF4249 domain-containing protein [Chitinophagaceae bacterium]
MKRNCITRKLPVAFVMILVACERDFNIDIRSAAPQLVVEGYINNEMQAYNYVVLSKSLDYYAPDFQSAAVSDAVVTVTEGELKADDEYEWNAASKVRLMESDLPQIPENFRKGVYFDPRLISDPAHALKGVPGKYYLLEIETDDKKYSAVAPLLPVVPIDSVTSGYYFTDEEGKEKARVTIHYKDPDTLGNVQLFYWRFKDNRYNFGWGSLGASRRGNGTDDLTNGEYIQLTQSHGFEIGDTVNYYMASVTRDVYNFWDSFNKARNNDGPFSTPVTVVNKIEGENVTGCFSGFSMSRRDIIMR